MESIRRSFAGDTKISKVIGSETDQMCMQKDRNNLQMDRSEPNGI